jgi:hypothetical protein
MLRGTMNRRQLSQRCRIEARDVAIRAEVRPEPGGTSLPIFRLRCAARAHNLNIYATAALLQVQNAEGKFATLATQPLPQPATDAGWQPLHFATVGPRSLGRYGGSLIFRGVSDLVLHPGTIQLNGKGRFRNLEVLLLDGFPENEALQLATAALAAP